MTAPLVSCDTNILLIAFNASAAGRARAFAFLDSHRTNDRFVLAEAVLMEFYVLLRNPAVLAHPLGAAAALDVVQQYRRHPSWRLVGDAGGSLDALWVRAAGKDFARLRIYDARLALTLRHHGVGEFATHNTKDFEGFGFHRGFDPLTP